MVALNLDVQQSHCTWKTFRYVYVHTRRDDTGLYTMSHIMTVITTYFSISPQIDSRVHKGSFVPKYVR